MATKSRVRANHPALAHVVGSSAALAHVAGLSAAFAHIIGHVSHSCALPPPSPGMRSAQASLSYKMADGDDEEAFLIIWERIYSELSLKRSGQVAKDFSPALWQVAAFGIFSTDRSRAGGCGFVSGTTQRSGQVVTDFIVGKAAGGCVRRSSTDRSRAGGCGFASRTIRFRLRLRQGAESSTLRSDFLLGLLVVIPNFFQSLHSLFFLFHVFSCFPFHNFCFWN
ncbi:hypothetical protein AXF42_Ash002414 [Apostasia shenzhenica]|uniref:Uncharacterized protein n=1 Tax=Apostasia shenzhenica TaxID=1088818 RepID=A0A2I0ANH2_9ASPA|nr:hypothetical protein AXF42_Ash002414 [Apostasia shenzhenica]